MVQLNPEHSFFKVNGITLHCAVQGSGPVMILLHGFPEFWYGWRHQIPVLSERFKVIAPDMRGYNLSDKPAGVENYKIRNMVEDIRELIISQSREKVVLAGHDWGGVAAWALALRYPELLEKLIILNAPHPDIMEREIRNNPKQRSASSYTLLLSSEDGEEKVSKDNFRFLRKAVFEGCLDPSGFDAEDREAYIKAWSQPGALTAMLNYYRAAAVLDNEGRKKSSDSGGTREKNVVKVPSMVIWGEQDQALTLSLLDGLEEYVEDLSVRRIPEATHWVLHDAPSKVNSCILEFAGGER